MSGQSTQILPLGTGAALTVTASSVIGSNPTRRNLWFANPNASATVYVAPAGTTTSPGGAGWLPVLAGAFLQFNDPQRATCGWLAAMATGTGNISMLEWPA